MSSKIIVDTIEKKTGDDVTLVGNLDVPTSYKITGTDADSIQAPGLITSAGGGVNSSLNTALNSATLGTGTTFPAGHIISVQSSEVTEGSMSMPSSGNNMDTVFGTHTHTFKSGNSKILVMWQGSIGMYEGSSEFQLYTECQIRHSKDSYASIITSQNMELIAGARTDFLIQFPGIFSAIHTPSHSAGDAHTYKMYAGSNSGNTIRSNRLSTGPMFWYTYEIAL